MLLINLSAKEILEYLCCGGVALVFLGLYRNVFQLVKLSNIISQTN